MNSKRRVEDGRSTGRLVIMTALLFCGISLISSCTPAGDGAEQEGSVCEEYDSDYCDVSSDSSGAYAPEHGLLYCEVKQLREQVVDGTVDLEHVMKGLPAWGDASYREGLPVIVDIRTTPAGEAAERLDVVIEAARDAGWHKDRGDYRACLNATGQETLEEELGGPLNVGS